MKRINAIIESNTKPRDNNTLWIKPKEGGGKELKLGSESIIGADGIKTVTIDVTGHLDIINALWERDFRSGKPGLVQSFNILAELPQECNKQYIFENLDNINYIEFFAYDRGSECKILILKERSRNFRVIGVDDDGEDIIEWLDSSYGKIFQLVEHARIVLEDKDSGAVKLKYTTVATTLQVVPEDDVFAIQTVCEPNAI